MAERSTADDSYGLQVWQVASTAVRNWSNARAIGSNHGLDIARWYRKICTIIRQPILVQE